MIQIIIARCPQLMDFELKINGLGSKSTPGFFSIDKESAVISDSPMNQYPHSYKSGKVRIF